MRGKFITLEGGDGSGKSTQTKRLVEFLRKKGLEVIQTREVGGSASAEAIRTLWLTQNEGYWDHLTELLLVMAARREHLVKTIFPALERGAWVVSDRFVDSTRVYQGVCQGLGVEVVDTLYQRIAPHFEPDLTLLLDLPVDIWVARMSARTDQDDDRYQRQDMSVHEKTRAAFLSLAKTYAHRFRTVDASQDPFAVTAALEKVVAEYFTL